MPPLPLTSALLTRLPWLSTQGRAVITALVCDNGRTRVPDLVAALGLHTRFQLGRLLRSDGLPLYEVLAGWINVIYWMTEADRTGATLLALARRARVDPAISYRTIRRITGCRWSELRSLGTDYALRRFLENCHPRRHGEPDSRRRWSAREDRDRQAELAVAHPRLPLRLPLSSAPFAVAVHGSRLAYITRARGAAVERLDLAARRFDGTIPVGCNPVGVAFDRAGTRAYVSVRNCDRIDVIDAVTHLPLATLPLPGNPFPVLLGRNENVLYVTTNEDRLYALSPRTARIVASVALPETSHHLALHPSGSRLYVATRAAGTVLEVDTLRHHVTRTFVTGGRPQGLAVSRDGRSLYVANERHGLNVVSLPTGRVLRTVDVGGAGVSLALSPDERHLCISLVFAGGVAIVDRASLTVRETLRTGGRPGQIAFDPAGRVMIVPNEAGWVDLVPVGLATTGSRAQPMGESPFPLVVATA